MYKRMSLTSAIGKDLVVGRPDALAAAEVCGRIVSLGVIKPASVRY